MSIAIGTTAPEFSLPAVAGGTRSLDDYAETPLLALVQSCNHCPYVQAWEGRMNAIQRDYAPRGFRLVAINSNDTISHPEDSFEEMTARAREQGFAFDYLQDESQEIARTLGSTRTPEVFLFDRDRRLVYHGLIDDSRDESAVTQHYLRDALDALLDGREPAVADTEPVGCTVKWRG
jgi:peroxiredoxin